MTGDGLIPIREADDIEALLAEPRVVLYKHSPLCGLSTMAAQEVRSFMESSPGVPVYMVDVIQDRVLSTDVARRLGVRHESPQAFVIERGQVAWHGSHRAVTASALERETAD